jgi:hypothetical protein
MPRMILIERSLTSALTAGRRVSSSKRWSRQPGHAESSRSWSLMGSPTLTWTVPNRSRRTRNDVRMSHQLSYFFGAPESSEM